MRFMADEERVQYKFMIPVSLKEALEKAAHRSFRSLSAEIIVRLKESVRDRLEVSDDPLVNERIHLETELQAIEAQQSMVAAKRYELTSRLHSVREEIQRKKDADLEEMLGGTPTDKL